MIAYRAARAVVHQAAASTFLANRERGNWSRDRARSRRRWSCLCDRSVPAKNHVRLWLVRRPSPSARCNARHLPPQSPPVVMGRYRSYDRQPVPVGSTARRLPSRPVATRRGPSRQRRAHEALQFVQCGVQPTEALPNTCRRLSSRLFDNRDDRRRSNAAGFGSCADAQPWHIARRPLPEAGCSHFLILSRLVAAGRVPSRQIHLDCRPCSQCIRKVGAKLRYPQSRSLIGQG